MMARQQNSCKLRVERWWHDSSTVFSSNGRSVERIRDARLIHRTRELGMDRPPRAWAKKGGPTLKRTLFVLALGAVGANAPASGHHSFAAHYLEEQTVWIQGDLVEFEYRNPHAWVHILAPDSSGQMQKYSAEWANPARLTEQGITRDTLKPGDRLIVIGSPPRDPAQYKMHLKRIERPADGWRWAGGRVVR
jgi:hypothetical protein